MAKIDKGRSATKHPDSQKALEILRKVRREGPEDRFRGMTEDQVIKAIKKTREEIWQEKLAHRP